MLTRRGVGGGVLTVFTLPGGVKMLCGACRGSDPAASHPALPNSPGFHQRSGLYSNKQRRRTQRFLFSFLLMALWLSTKSTVEPKHASDNVSSKHAQQKQSDAASKQIRDVLPSRCLEAWNWTVFSVCCPRGKRKKDRAVFIPQSDELTLNVWSSEDPQREDLCDGKSRLRKLEPPQAAGRTKTNM